MKNNISRPHFLGKNTLKFGKVFNANGTRCVATENNEPSKTDQSFAEECDVNNIMQKYIKTGEIHHVNRKAGVYADLSDIKDLTHAYEIIGFAQQAFSGLPSELRDKFLNNPQNLINYLNDPSNDEEAISLGLKNPIPQKNPLTQKTSEKSEKNQKKEPSEET